MYRLDAFRAINSEELPVLFPVGLHVELERWGISAAESVLSPKTL